jgi:hypothetical protein
MRNRTRLTFAGTLVVALAACAAMGAPRQVRETDTSALALNPGQVRALVARAILNQHKDDAALEEYELTERMVSHGKDGAVEEKTTRIVPHATGTFQIELERNGMPTDPGALEEHWHDVAQALAAESNASNPLLKLDQEKAAKRNRERDQLEDAIGQAFIFHWAGHTDQDNRSLIELTFEPNPSYKPSVRLASIYAHIRGAAWVDESSGHVAKVAAELFSDVPFGGGVVAKFYQGGKLTVEQEPVAPDVWLPVHYSLDVDGRKFLFSIALHQQIDMSAQVRVGPPKETLVLIEREHPGVAAGNH